MSISAHGRTFKQLVAQSRQRQLEALAAGVPEQHYWRIVGTIEGLDVALALSDEADFQLSGESDDAGS